jgi:hypothetical protein
MDMTLRRLVAPVFSASVVLLLAPAGAQAACAYPQAYPGDGAPKARLAAWLAGGAVGAGQPGELPVMGALVESGLQNLAQDDADSAGFFRMRVGIWNQGAYAGFPADPSLQRQWFTDQAAKVRDAAVVGGNATYGADSATWGEWVADVIRPPDIYRSRYQLRLEESRTLIAAGCDAPPDGGGVGTGGGDPPPADTTAPTLKLGGEARQPVLKRREIRVRVACPAEACTARISGTVSIPAAARVYRLSAPAAALGAGQTKTVRLPVGKRLARRAARQLRRGRSVRAKLTIVVADAAGNRSTATRTIRFEAPH